MNYTKARKEIEEQINQEREEKLVEEFKDILREEDIELYY